MSEITSVSPPVTDQNEYAAFTHTAVLHKALTVEIKH